MILRSVTFDLDGTLLDTVADLAEACRRMLEELAFPARTPAEVHSFVGKGMVVLVERCLTHAEPPSEETLQRAVVSFRRHYAEVSGLATTVYPGVREGLAAFRAAGYKLGVVTNKPDEFTRPLLAHMEMNDFDVVVSGDTTAHKKPHPAPILHACAAMGTDPQHNLHIGDSANDVLAARAAGCAVYCVPYGYNEGQPVDSAECDALVSNLLAALARCRQSSLLPSSS